jgi:hypothetical protein
LISCIYLIKEIKPQIISTSRFSQHLPTIKSSESFCPDNNNNDNFLFDDPEPVPCKKKFTVVYVDEAATSTGICARKNYYRNREVPLKNLRLGLKNHLMGLLLKKVVVLTRFY